jgi:Zn-dependent protease with chaperone function
MQRLQRSSAFWCLFLVLFAPVWVAPASRAQGSPDEDDERIPPSLHVSVDLSADGASRINAWQSNKGNAPTAIKPALQAALGCTLKDSPWIRGGSAFYNGTCRVPFTGSLLLHQVRIATGPLVGYATQQQLETLNVNIVLPDSDVAETDPSLVRRTIYPSVVSPDFKHLVELNRTYTWNIGTPIPESLVIHSGYHSASIARAALMFLAVLFAPVLLVAWLGRRALSAQTADKSSVWFSYMRYLQWMLNGSLLGWWIATESFHLIPLLKFLSAGSWIDAAWKFPGTSTLVNWFPPAVTWFFCFVLSHPVREKLRGLSWTRRELVLQAVYSFSASLLPVALVLTGFSTMATGSFRGPMLWFVAAFVVRLVASQALLKILGMQPQALTTGDLRDRAFAMAKQLGVKLQQVYVIPSGKGQMANAFARTGNSILFTDFLLQRMSRREVDYVMGHELTHLKMGHPRKLSIAYLVGIFVVIGLTPFVTPYLHGSVILRYALIVGIVTLFPYFWSRRFEYAADAGAVEVTGDPQAAISALFKLAQLNMLPIHWSQWSEKWLTHPSSLRRAQAIARKAGIPLESIPEIAQAATPADDRYPVPATVAPGAKVHSTQRKQQGTLRTALLMLAAIIFTPAAFALLARHLPANGPVHVVIYVAGFAAALGMYLVSANFAPTMGHMALTRALKNKLEKEDILADAWDGTCVGFSPAATPRSYELNTNWDVGCLFIRSDRICYVGEETRFALRREQITKIVKAPGVPGLLRPWRVYVAWKDDESGTSGAFNIGSIDDLSTLRLRRHTSKLADRLEFWWKSATPTRSLPVSLRDLGSPNIGAVTGADLSKRWKPGKIVQELLLTGILASFGAVLCGLPFHLLSFLLPTTQAVPLHSPGAGWYVIVVAVTVRLIALIPSLTFKERAVVSIPPPNAGKGEAKASGGGGTTESPKLQNEPILSR